MKSKGVSWSVPRRNKCRGMVGGDTESDEGAFGLEEDYEDPEQVGVKATGVRVFLKSRRTVGVSLWCGYVGGYPPHGTGPGGFLGPGDVATDGAAPTEEARWEVGVHLGGGGESRGRV